MKLSLVLPIVFSVLLAIVGGVLLLNRPPDASAQLGGPLEAALKSRGISVENLVVTGTDEGVEVSITTSAGGEPTALRPRTVIEKELAYLKSDGQTAAEWVTVVIRDEVENVNGIKPAFYRLSIQDADTYEPLVEWVVDAQKVSVRGWTAESVDADLAMFPPSKIPEGNTTTTGTSEE